MEVWMRGLLEADRASAELTMAVVSYATGVEYALIAAATRGAQPVAFARQLSMYLLHVVFELSLARVAAAFERDRSTVGHACHLIEDRREDRQFDAWIASLEAMLQEAPLRARRNAA